MDNPDAQRIAAGYRRYGAQVPQGLIPPPLHDVEQFYWSAYAELQTNRQPGGAIPSAVIRDYAEKQVGAEKELFVEIMRILDSESIMKSQENRADS